MCKFFYMFYSMTSHLKLHNFTSTSKLHILAFSMKCHTFDVEHDHY